MGRVGISRKEIEPTDDDKKIKWENRCDEARGLIGMSIYRFAIPHIWN